ncbi:DNA/RNA non-specific endonuclease [Flammeovirga sp. SJP92]|uniref:DNA/RNA non-specific endonuclease n=1 Tax=Flammeovirga sp. SJP92 TaxID=1775430 RepID=UPI000789498B|nr:DNA/RNA non-specific endonuclease [Flammeovirga sp. SJP92]KXX67273.1 hypothetical protein AVL50_28205 [Flammeovirga sp. SJP92]
MKLKFSLLIVFIVTAITSFSQDYKEVPKSYFPSFEENYQIIRHKNYIIAYSEEHEQAAFVIYKLTKEELHKHVDRSDHFEVDQDVTTSSADEDDYYHSGYDRGHLAPAADMSFSETAMEESFYYSNMSPQLPSFNRGIWKRMEEQVRDWAYLKDSIIVITGPVLEDDLKEIGPNHVSIPEYFFKVILFQDEKNEFNALGMLVENKKSSLPLSHYYVPVDSIESVTNINFFPGLTTQEEFENHYDAVDWPVENISYELIEEEEKEEHKEDENARQCEAYTKSGQKCKRKANENSRFCWQHQ